MSERKPGTDGPKQPPWGLIGAAVVVAAVAYAGFVIFARVM